MSGGPDEIQASMNPEVRFFVPLWLLLLPHISFVLVVNEVDDGRPGVTIVDVVTKTGCVDDGELDLELLLLKLSLDDFNLRQLVQLFVVAPTVVLRGRELGRKEGVDEGGLSETGFALKKLSIIV